ncbi:hypothetical protein RND81_11G215000 [Saponaria officinalis]|uniref:ARM repeat N-terminal plant domain-containing protein n=1 Tax=Saponaria officinalis TaxID=3572 RepID=A0AAW1HR06_SAPOF
MNSQVQKPCTKPYCFFCVMNESNLLLRRTNLAKIFKTMAVRDDKEHVLVLCCLWNIAMNQPNDLEFPSLGIFHCMSKLILKGVHHKNWLLKDQNIYIPYYASHIIGSYTMNNPKLAKKAVFSDVIPPLLRLLRGDITWVEQRVAVRALGHLATYDVSFNKLIEYEGEIVKSCMNIASNCLKIVYNSFVQKNDVQRLKYHSDLLTRGVGGYEFEGKKAKEWASQLQCWSISLLICFVKRERCINLICNDQVFIKELSDMWGGLVNQKSPCGIGLLRSLCDSKIGRFSVASSKEAILGLCNISRSSNEWQYMAIETLLLIIKDQNTRYKVIDPIIFYLKDLVEVGKIKGGKKVGEKITQVLLQDYGMVKCGKVKLGENVERVMKEIWEVKVEKRKNEKLMSEKEILEGKNLATKMKKEGNKLFLGGDIEGSLVNYTNALVICPLRYKKERVVLYSNRAQCYLLLKDPKCAISDTTRAICLSTKNPHSKSLWRRSQAYDMLGLAKESLMDSLMFINCDNCTKSKRRRRFDVPYYVTRLISKQNRATWLFANVDSTSQYDRVEVVEDLEDRKQDL